MSRDTLYASDHAPAAPFEFNEDVAGVFPDMLERSIPGYGASIQAIGTLAARYVQAGTRCYDLGCSLGAASLAMRRNIAVPGCTIVAVDNAPAMVKRCQQLVRAVSPDEDPDGTPTVSVVEQDIRDTRISNASMVVMNYTLQFLPVDARTPMIEKVASGMVDGGVFVLSEKVSDPDVRIDDVLIDLHHEFKRRNCYSELEISRKRAALEDVLLPESVAAHTARLQSAGFRHIGVWLRCFNFVSILAVR